MLFLQIGYDVRPPAVLRERRLNLADQPDPLYVPLGDVLRGESWLSLVKLDSVLIAGSRRMGKTNLIHGWIQALLHGGAIDLWLWDGKPSEVEFRGYSGQRGVTVLRERELNDGLTRLWAIIEQRARDFALESCVNINDYNARFPDRRLRPIALIVDEVAAISDLPNADENLSLLNDIIKRGGAFGVHPVLATQLPNAAAVHSVIKVNLVTRIALSLPDSQSSVAILGRSGAEKLPKVKGRLTLTWEGSIVEAQAFLTDPHREAGVESDRITDGEISPITSASESEADTVSQPAPIAVAVYSDQIVTLATRCATENSGRFTEAWLRSIGLGRNEARATQADWVARGYVAQDVAQSNAYCLSSPVRQALGLVVLSQKSGEPAKHGGLANPGKPQENA